MKRQLTLMLAILLSLPIFARDFTYTYEGEALTYTVIDEEAKTCKTKDGTVYTPGNGSRFSMYFDGNLIIPSAVYDGASKFSVIEIGDYGFNDCSDLTSVTIPDAVTSIGNHAFERCRSLTSITLPDAVTSIGESAFEACSSLTSITLPDAVTSIGESAFGYCSSLTSITLPDAVTRIGERAFYGCSGLTSVTIPNAVTCIGESAFYGCRSLTGITLPDAVTSIGANAFRVCSSLTSITLPDAVTSIEKSTFYGCSGLTSITIPDAVTRIGERAFYGCSGLTSVTIPNAVTRIGESAFRDCSGLKELYFNAENCTECGGEPTESEEYLVTFCAAFPGTLETIKIGNNVKTIPNYAFRWCYGLTSITLPDAVISIGSRAFDGCSGLSSITIPKAVTSIGSRAFDGCSGLSSITIPKAVTSIGESAFSGCSGLKELDYNAENCTVGIYIFPSTLETVKIGNNVKTIPAPLFLGCSGLKELYYNAENCTVGRNIFPSTLETVKIGNNIKTIPDYLFSGCSSLKEVIFLGIPKNIGYYAFESTDIEKVAIPCLSDWTQVSFSDYSSNPMWNKSILEVNGKQVHNLVLSRPRKWNMSAFSFYGASIDKARITANLVGDYALCGSSIKALCIDVNAIGAGAFSSCSDLTAVYSMTAEPPTAPDDAFSAYDNVTLYVPRGARSAYENSVTCWWRFSNIIETDFADIDELFKADYVDGGSGVEDIVYDNDTDGLDIPVEVYNLNGVKVSDSFENLTPGIYIIRQGRKVRKQIIR